jgi:hypothetical protein
MLRPITEHEFRRLFKEGVRDFRNIRLEYFGLNELDLSGCDFSGSEFFGGAFWGTKLIGADFSHCKLEWMEFSFADLTDAKFIGSKLGWGAMNCAKVRNTDFSGAEIRRFSFYGTPIDSAILKGTGIIHCFRYESELTLKDLEEMIQKMRAMGMPANVVNNIELVYNKGKKAVDEGGKAEFGFDEKKGLYLIEDSSYSHTPVKQQDYKNQKKGVYEKKSVYEKEDRYHG